MRVRAAVVGRGHHVEVAARVGRVRHKRHSLEEEGAAGLVHDCVAEDDGVAHVVHLRADGQRLAHREAQVPAARD